MLAEQKRRRCMMNYVTCGEIKGDDHEVEMIILNQAVARQQRLALSEELTVVPLPPRFRVPKIELYDGSRDLFDHLENFKVHITLHRFIREFKF